MSEITDDLLKFLVKINGRIAFPIDDLRQIVAPNPKAKKQLQAYNLCDGNKRISDIAASCGIDRGNFSRTIARWQELGICSRVGPDENPLHIYPLAE
jgi:hypothetical protein